uniref:GPI ethanolamine phosphate transferase 3 n=1 Tax=Schistosoma mansoni TaxID=6183 RepID=A0A5K4F039_SCHMA
MEYMIKRCSRSLAKYINKNRDYEISILSKLLSIIIAFLGIGLFLHGFLLNRTELYNETNEKLKLSLKNPLTVARNGRIILLLVDALGYALIQNNNENNQFLPDHISPHSQNQSRPQLNSLSKAAYIGKFIADPPTTTLQRLKALMTGSMPTFIDAGSNFGGNKVLEDNLLKQWNKAGKQIRFVGDETWIDLFPDCFSHYKAYSSFNVKDLDTVDRGVENYFLHALNSTSLDWNNEVVDNKTPQTHWDILIGHMLGIDHCGHTYGPAHPEMMRKLNELNSFIELIVSKLQSSDILFILGDHGMTRSGDHGGDSDAELEAAFIVFTADKDSLIIKDDSENQTNRRLCQIDLVPTLSLLTNVPIPYSNLGILYDHLLGHGANVHQGMVLNFIQMFTYTANYYYNISKLPLSPILISYMDRIMLSSTYDWIEQLNDIQLVTILKELQSIFRIHWTQFNDLRIFFGLFLTTFSLITLLLSIEKVYSTRDIHISILFLLFTCILSFICLLGYYSNIFLFFIFVLLFISLLYLILTYHHSSKLIFSDLLNRFNDNFIGFLLLFLLSSSYLSNSMIIYEFHVTLYLIQSLIVVFFIDSFIHMDSIVMTSLYSLNPIGLKFLRICSSLPCLPFMTLLYLSIMLLFRLFIRQFLICREELSNSSLCRSILDPWLTKSLNRLNPIHEFYPIGGIRVMFAILMLIIYLRLYWRLLSEYQNISMSLNQSNKANWKKLSLFILIGSLLSLLWMMDSAESTNWIRFIPKDKLHTVRIWVARILLITIFYIFFQLVKSPFHLIEEINFIKCIQSNDCSQSTQRTIVYLYTLWTMTCFMVLPFLSLLVFLNEFHIIWLVFIIIFIQLRIHVTAIKCNHMDKCNKNSLLLHVPQKCISWILAIFLCLLDNLSFFITGHQPTLSGIPWDAAYAAYEGDHNTRWLPGLTVLLHLYSGPIIIAFSLPTIIILSSRLQYVHGTVIHSHSNKSRNTSFYRFVDALDLFIWRFIISKSVLTLGCMLSTGLLRRHLMVWKIFAPHLLFSMLSLLISAVCLPLIRFLVVYCLHNRICKILKSHFNIHKCV